MSTLQKLINRYENHLAEKRRFLRNAWHNDVVEGIATQLEQIIQDLKQLEKEQIKKIS